MRKLTRKSNYVVVLLGARNAKLPKAQRTHHLAYLTQEFQLKGIIHAGGTSTSGAPSNKSARECA